MSYFSTGISSMCILCCALYFMSSVSHDDTSSVYMYARIFVHIFVCLCVCVCLCLCVWLFRVFLDVLSAIMRGCAFSVCVLTCAPKYLYHVDVCMRASVYICVGVHMCVYVMLYLQVYVFIFILA